MAQPRGDHTVTVTPHLVVGIVGSRRYSWNELAPVRQWVTRLSKKHPGAVVVSGGARGVDQAAERAARDRGLDVISFRPYRHENMDGREEWSIETRTSGDRAQQIVSASRRRSSPPYFRTFAQAAKRRNAWIVETADHLVAFWDGESRGTRDTIRRAQKTAKLAAVYPDEAAVIAELERHAVQC